MYFNDCVKYDMNITYAYKNAGTIPKFMYDINTILPDINYKY